MTIEQTDKVRLLATLCRELAARGLDVGMSDAKPALSVRPGRTESRLWVGVDLEHGAYEWGDGRRHTADDPAGAAERISSEMRGIRNH